MFCLWSNFNKSVYVFELVKKARQYITFPVFFAFFMWKLEDHFPLLLSIYSAHNVNSPKMLSWKEYVSIHNLSNMYKLLNFIYFYFKYKLYQSISKISLVENMCNIINLTVCKLKKQLLGGKILLKFHFNKSHGNVKLST